MLCQRSAESRTKSNPTVFSACPCCGKAYDGSTNRCVQDACGHFRCFLCVFQGVKCVNCFPNQSHQRPNTQIIKNKGAANVKPQRHQQHSNEESRKPVCSASNVNSNVWQTVRSEPDVTQMVVTTANEDPDADDEDHHYWLYQPLDEKATDPNNATGASNAGQARRENLLLPNVDSNAQFATSRLMTPIAEEDSQLSSDEEIDMPALGIPNATGGQIIDHIYCSISDDDLPSKEFEDSIAESSFPDIIRPSIGIAPRLPPRRPDAASTTSISSSTNSQTSAQNPAYDPGRSIQGTGSSESLKSLSTDSSSNTVRNSASILIANNSLVAAPKQQKSLHGSSVSPSGWPSASYEAQLKMNKSTSLSSVCVSSVSTTTTKHSVKPLSVSCTPAKPFGTMPCAPLTTSTELSSTSQKRLSVSAFPPPSITAGAQAIPLSLTDEKTHAHMIAEGQIIWRPIRFDMPEFSLDVAISGRTWLIALIEDSLLQPSFEGDTLCKGVLVVGSSGTGKTKLFAHLVLHSAIADDVFVETAELRKGAVSRSRESLEESSRSADSLQLDSNHSSLKSNGSATAGAFTTCSAQSDNLSNHSGTHTPARNTNSFDASLSYESQKDSPASTVDSGIKTSPANTLNNFSSEGTVNPGVPLQPNYDTQFSMRGLTSSNTVSTSNCYFLSQRVLAAFFCQATDCSTNNVGNIVHTLIYHAQNRVAPYKKLLLNDEKLSEVVAVENCSKNPLDAMRNGLFDPMSQLLADGQIVGDYFIILIDAIDDKEQSLCNFLSSLLHTLPSWIKLLCSCRKESFSKMSNFVQTLEVFNLEDNFFSKDVEISKDLDMYISYLVTNSSSNLKEIIFNSREIFNKLRSILLSNCQRSFLYIRSCFDLINSGAINLKSLSKNSVPQTLYAIFELLCNQICHSSLAIFHKIRVIIDVIITSFYPMTVEEIWNVVRLSKYSKEEFDKNFELVHGQFLVMRNNRTFEFSSNCLRSWFIDPKLSKKFSCDLRLGHALHAIALAYSTMSSSAAEDDFRTCAKGICSELDMTWHLVQCELFGTESCYPMYDHNLLWLNWLLTQDQMSSILGNMQFLMAPNLKVCDVL